MSTAPVVPGPHGRRPTPRPQFAEPHVIRRTEAVAHVWGDVESGYVTDRVLSSTDQLHVLEYELPPGGGFRHSALNPTVFGADVLYYTLEGSLLLCNPATGEVVTGDTGTGRLFHRGTWHNAFNASAAGNVRVLEFFSPPPSRGTASDFARRQEILEDARYADQRWVGRWPAARAEREASTTFHRVSRGDALLSFRDELPSHLVATLVSTEFLTVVEGTVQPGHVEEFRPVESESIVVVTEGELWLDVWSQGIGYQATSVLGPGDSMFLPVGCRERMLVRAALPARYLCGSGHVPDGWAP
jgi:quercetin dioxygenase-like cupin family protein